MGTKQRTLYLLVTADELELPAVVAESVGECRRVWESVEECGRV